MVKVWTKLGFPERQIRMVGEFFKEQPQLGRSLLRKHASRADTHALLNPWPLEPILYLMAKAHRHESKKLILQRVREFLTELRQIQLSITTERSPNTWAPKGTSLSTSVRPYPDGTHKWQRAVQGRRAETRDDSRG